MTLALVSATLTGYSEEEWVFKYCNRVGVYIVNQQQTCPSLLLSCSPLLVYLTAEQSCSTRQFYFGHQLPIPTYYETEEKTLLTTISREICVLFLVDNCYCLKITSVKLKLTDSNCEFSLC